MQHSEKREKGGETRAEGAESGEAAAVAALLPAALCMSCSSYSNKLVGESERGGLD